MIIIALWQDGSWGLYGNEIQKESVRKLHWGQQFRTKCLILHSLQIGCVWSNEDKDSSRHSNIYIYTYKLERNSEVGNLPWMPSQPGWLYQGETHLMEHNKC